MAERPLLGEIFIARGLITPTTLERALARARRLNQPIGFTLEEMEVITDRELADALASQFELKIVADFARYKFPAELLALVPVDLAMRRLVFPLKRDGQRLAMAMADPTERDEVAELFTRDRLTIAPFVATRRDVMAAINRHYLGKDPNRSEERTVLVVEDNKLIFTMVADMLKRGGYRVLQAGDGMEAYKLALAELPHVIITDKEMPKLDGYALFDTLQRMPETRRTPILLLTGVNNPDEEARALEKGFFDFLAKPVKEKTLLTRVNRAFASVEQVALPGSG